MTFSRFFLAAALLISMPLFQAQADNHEGAGHSDEMPMGEDTADMHGHEGHDGKTGNTKDAEMNKKNENTAKKKKTTKKKEKAS